MHDLGSLGCCTSCRSTAQGGPCPPIGRHRYFDKLYALDAVLPDLKRPTKKALEEAMEGHLAGETPW